MAFQVTQCPKCESTFNTDLRLLDLAAGKVRCGACLAVFQAEENFLFDEADATSTDESESVFVGGEPDDFFDPAVFLTRSSLQESTEFHTPDTQAPYIPEDQAPETQEEFSETAQHAIPSNEQAEETVASEAEAIEAGESAAIVSESDEAEESHLEFFAAINESLDQVHEFDGIEDLQTIAELNGLDNPNTDMFTSPRDEAVIDEVSPVAPIDNESGIDEDVSEEEIEAVLSGELDEEDQGNTETETSHEAIEEQEDSEPVELDAIRSEPDPKPEDVTLSLSFAVEPQRGILRDPKPEADEQSHLEINDEPSPDSSQAINQPRPDEDSQELLTENAESSESPSSDDVSEHVDTRNFQHAESEDVGSDIEEFNQAIEEQEFNDSLEPSDAQELTRDELDMELESLGSADSPESVLPEDLDDGNLNSEDVDTSTEAIRARALQTEYQDEEALESIPQANLQALDAMSQPVELSGQKPKTWGRRIAYGVLSLLFGGVLAGQYTWREIDRYAQEPVARQIFQRICAELSCELPEYSNIDAIVSNNLTVRSHPEREDGLVVAVEMRNTAQFPQAFPVLILSFNTSSNEVIALREFYPNEYLDPGLRDIEMMPVLAPVQVGIEIIDPGGDAMNYTMAFRLP